MGCIDVAEAEVEVEVDLRPFVLFVLARGAGVARLPTLASRLDLGISAAVEVVALWGETREWV